MAAGQAFLTAGGVVLGIVMIGLCMKTGKPLRAFFGTAIPGVLSLVAINYAAFFTGVGLAVNSSSVFAAVVLGLPGVIFVLIGKMLWGIG